MQSCIKRAWALSGLVIASLLAGCATTIDYKSMPAAAESKEGRRTLAIFLDGTANDEKSDTNVKKLHSLVTLQERRDIATLYVEGVGTGGDAPGAGLGVGTKKRVMIAYEFILANYRKEADRIFIFGFSRGAYAGRILTSLLYHAGLAKGEGLTSTEIANLVYDATKAEMDASEEAGRLAAVHKELAEKKVSTSQSVKVNFLGLWDTVEALGVRDLSSKLAHKSGLEVHTADVDNANPRYGDKLCNVEEVRHAMAIDDNREWIFTPRLMTRDFLYQACAKSSPLLKGDLIDTTKMKEVWFAGAHSDVGGGYSDSQLSGVSLNWMLDELRRFDLIPVGAKAPEDIFGTSHNPESGMWSVLYHHVNRDVVGYSLHERTKAPYRGTIWVHDSVFKRRAFMPALDHENSQLLLKRRGTACLTPLVSEDRAVHGRWKEAPLRPDETCSSGITLDVRQFTEAGPTNAR